MPYFNIQYSNDFKNSYLYSNYSINPNNVLTINIFLITLHIDEQRTCEGRDLRRIGTSEEQRLRKNRDFGRRALFFCMQLSPAYTVITSTYNSKPANIVNYHLQSTPAVYAACTA